jgi:histidinol dehydrogenase
MAFGTESMAPVDKIVGPGNVWVTEAKWQVSRFVGIDGLAGPTELVVVADSSADPRTLTVDLVAQAEHDPMARFLLMSLDPGLPQAVDDLLEEEVGASPRSTIVEEAAGRSAAVIVGGEDEAAALVDRMAPEHLQIVTREPWRLLEAIRSYGAAFLGVHTPVSFGDYGIGSNHVLPTMGTARFASGLRASDFVTVRSFVEASSEAAARLGPGIEVIARSEGLEAHARASEARR